MRRPPFRLVIFDCDGVMFDSRQANEAFYNHILSHFGLPPMDPGDVDFVHMATAEDSVNHIIRDESVRTQAQAYRLAMSYEPFNRLMVMEPDLIDILRFLQSRFLTAVATNRSNTIRPLLDAFDLTDYFNLVVSSLDVRRPKPDPESIHLILDKLAVPADEALFIGDSESDAGAGRSAGVHMAAFRNPALTADYHINDLKQIKTIVNAPED